MVEKKAINRLESLGYDQSDFNIETRFYSNRYLLDSLQKKIGRQTLIDRFQREDLPNIELFYWEVRFFPDHHKGDQVVLSSDDEADNRPNSNAALKMRYDDSGKFRELRSPNNVIPQKSVGRAALAATFGKKADMAATVLAAYSDTTLNNRILVDVQQHVGEFNLTDSEQVSHLNQAMQHNEPFRLSAQDVFDMASYYLQNTGWDLAEFARDTVSLGRVSGNNTVTAKFRSVDPSFKQQLSVAVRMTSAGSLAGISADYSSDRNGSAGGDLWSLVEQMLILLFCLGVIVLFFFRIRVRAVDTQPALVIAILAGLAVSLLAGLFMFDRNFSASSGWTQSAELLIGTGISGAGASLGFFMLFGVADSVTRQHWAKKLEVYDYLRQGMLFNKPVGFMLVQSVTLAFILAGLWTLQLWAMPGFFLDFEKPIFISHQAAWPPFYMLLSNGVYSLAIVLGVFMVLGSQTLAQTKNKVIAGVLMVLGCGVVVPVSGAFGPHLYELLAGLIFGGALLFIYLRWDFLTLLVSHFLFLGLLSTVTGWMIPASIDTNIFILIAILTAAIFVAGLIAIGKGKEAQMLSRYVPQYVEELAQEERIKQELQIAREVQQSFLPVRTPEFANLELAAICKPAYETGGDYYDFVQLDDHRVAVMIGDVSGKGIQAAFYMTFVKGVIHSLCREIDSPAEVLKKTNRLFYDNAPRGTFISLVYGIIDLKEQTFHFARAGHNPILRIRSGNGSLQELQPKGIGIGLAKGEAFEKHIEEMNVPLSGDDLLVLYTDGIVEALNEQQTFYGTQRLNSILKRNQSQSAREILEVLSEDVKSFVGNAKQHDDMTMLIMKLKEH